MSRVAAWLTGKPANKHTLANLKSLHATLERHRTVTHVNEGVVVESLWNLCETILYGEQQAAQRAPEEGNEGFFDYFCEKNMLELFLALLRSNRPRVQVQVIQSVSMLVQNITTDTSLFYLLSNDYINSFIEHPYDFREEELTTWFVSFLKTMALRLDQGTVQFFFDGRRKLFPLYMRALPFIHHPEGMIRIAVRTITLSVYRVQDPSMWEFVTTGAPAAYVQDIVHLAVEHSREINGLAATCTIQRRDKLEDVIAAHFDHLCYLQDILDTDVAALKALLCGAVVSGLVRSLLLESLLPREAEDDTLVSPLVALTVLAHSMIALQHPPTLSRALELMLLPDAPPPAGSEGAAAHHHHPDPHQRSLHDAPRVTKNLFTGEGATGAAGYAPATTTASITGLEAGAPDDDAWESVQPPDEDLYSSDESDDDDDDDDDGLVLDGPPPEPNAYRAAIVGALAAEDEQVVLGAVMVLLAVVENRAADRHVLEAAGVLPPRPSRDKERALMTSLTSPPSSSSSAPAERRSSGGSDPPLSRHQSLTKETADEDPLRLSGSGSGSEGEEGEEDAAGEAEAEGEAEDTGDGDDDQDDEDDDFQDAKEEEDDEEDDSVSRFLRLTSVHSPPTTPDLETAAERAAREEYEQRKAAREKADAELAQAEAQREAERQARARRLHERSSSITESWIEEAQIRQAVAAAACEPAESFSYSFELVDALLRVLQRPEPPRLVTLQTAVKLLRALVLHEAAPACALAPEHWAGVQEAYRGASERMLRHLRGPLGDLFLNLFEDEVRVLRRTRGEHLSLESLSGSSLLLLPIAAEPSSGVALEFRRPAGELEQTRKAIQVYLLLRSLRYELVGAEDAGMQHVLGPAPDVSESSAMELSGRDCLACLLPSDHDRPRPRQLYLVLDSALLLLAEPDRSQLTRGIATTVAPLHHAEAAIDKKDPRILFVATRSHTPIGNMRREAVGPAAGAGGGGGAGSGGVPGPQLWHLALVFESPHNCSIARQHLERNRIRLRTEKMRQISTMLSAALS